LRAVNTFEQHRANGKFLAVGVERLFGSLHIRVFQFVAQRSSAGSA